jgi:hypothetical protein
LCLVDVDADHAINLAIFDDSIIRGNRCSADVAIEWEAARVVDVHHLVVPPLRGLLALEQVGRS